METLFDLKNESKAAGALTPEGAYLFRAKRRAVLLANFLLDEKGGLIRIDEAKKSLQTQGYIPKGLNEASLTTHMLKVLDALPSLRHQLKSFGLPVCDEQIEKMILITVEADNKITDRHVIWAVLSALLCPLRQSVGSCFATAPAILIQEEQMGQFLSDMQSLLAKGQLTRVFGGNEYTVPISPSPGIGELKKPCQWTHPGFVKALSLLPYQIPKAESLSYLEVLQKFVKPKDFEKTKWTMIAFSEPLLLKVWEFTLASFVDVKTEFSTWNLFASLGIHSEEKGGIGELAFQLLQDKLNQANEKLEKFQIDYEIAFDHVRATERLLKNAATEAEGRRLKAEYQARIYHMHSCEELRNKFHTRAQNMVEFFPFFIKTMVTKFQEHFQVVYDAEMQEVKGTIYDDSPAGFRLLYKHGRTHVGSWTFIHSQKEYTEALRTFFLSVEYPIAEACKWEEGKTEVSSIITAIIHHIQTEEFITSALERMKRALRSINARPWAYISGGTLPTLLSTYFRREGSFSEETRYVTSPQELCLFLLDTLKSLPPRVTDLFVRYPDKRMLMTSPTHAFSLLPGQDLFRKGWEDPGFTYTWVRDTYLNPQRQFYEKILLNSDEQIYLCKELAKRLPLLEAYELEKGFQGENRLLTLEEFAKVLPPSPHLDSVLFEMLPLISAKEAKALVKGLVIPSEFLGRRAFCEFVASTLAPPYNHDAYASLAQAMRDKGLAPPRPLLFADTNWAKFYFSFIVHPVTKELELWRTDLHGFTGAPMKDWDLFLNGGIKETWSLLTNPQEYTGST